MSKAGKEQNKEKSESEIRRANSVKVDYSVLSNATYICHDEKGVPHFYHLLFGRYWVPFEL